MSVRLRPWAAVALMLALAGTGRADPVTVIDGTGATVRWPRRPGASSAWRPVRPSCCTPPGAGDRVVAVTDPADWPPEAAQRPRVGDARALDLERIVSLTPDLAVAWPYVAPAQIERLQALGIPIYRTDPHTPEAIALDIERLGALAGTAEVARPAAARFRSRLGGAAPARARCERGSRVLRDLASALVHDRRRAPDQRRDRALRR